MQRSAWLSIQICVALFVGLAAADESGPESSLFKRDLPAGQTPGETLKDTSWIFTPIPPAKEIRQYDILSIRVEVGAKMLSEGDVQRRKNALYNGVLLDWIRLSGLDAVKPAPQRDGDPRVKAQLDQLYRAEGETESRSQMTFNIAATIVDIRPNGTLVLEAHSHVRDNNDVWELSLSGICRREDVGPGNVVLSRDIADLRIDKRERGHIRDSYRRGWVLRFFDRFNPF